MLKNLRAKFRARSSPTERRASNSRHDPLCLSVELAELADRPVLFCDCERVARIRADERHMMAE